MTYREVRFQNIGPIESGEVRRHPVAVFVGPTGSGKSIAARLIHGACLLDSPPASRRLDLYVDEGEVTDNIMSYVGHAIMKGAGISASGIPTHKKAPSSLEVATDKMTRKKIDCKRLGDLPAPDCDFGPTCKPDGGQIPSMYVPADRAAIAQSLANAVRARSEALRHATAPGHASPSPSPSPSDSIGARNDPEQKTPDDIRQDACLRLPEHLEAFYDAVFQSLAGPPSPEGRKAFSRIFPGSVVAPKASGAPMTAYRSPDGFEAEIAAAASGILSSFPILECARRVQKGGLLIVEEPEAHLEPARQLYLVEELAKMARARPFGLVLVTHSDYTLNSVLSLVARGILHRGELGLYYFERKSGSPHARIKQVPIDDTGSAEQGLFEDALETLRERFT